MQITLYFFPESPIYLDFSYYPKLAAAVYQILAASDAEFSSDLHHGSEFRNRIKLFGFSPLYSRQTEIRPVVKNQNRCGGLVFKGACTFTICSPWTDLINRLMDGFSKKPELRMGSQTIHVREIAFLQPPLFENKMRWYLRRPASCVTSWSPKNTGQKHYVLPDAPVNGESCEALLKQNLIHKWRRLKEVRPDIALTWLEDETDLKEEDLREENIKIRILPISSSKRVHPKRHQIKNAPVLSWIAPVEITGPKAIQRIAWSCGLGEMNSMGFGMVEEA